MKLNININCEADELVKSVKSFYTDTKFIKHEVTHTTTFQTRKGFIHEIEVTGNGGDSVFGVDGLRELADFLGIPEYDLRLH